MASNILPKDHGIVAAEWQLEAAGKLTAIILPLASRIAKSGSDYHRMAGKSYCVSPIEPDGSLDEIFKVGDHIYLQEKWGGHGEARTMPAELAQHWYTVTGIRVTQVNDLTPRLLLDANLTDVSATHSSDLEEAAHLVRQAGCGQKWNQEFAPLRWEPRRWVVVLEVIAAWC